MILYTPVATACEHCSQAHLRSNCLADSVVIYTPQSQSRHGTRRTSPRSRRGTDIVPEARRRPAGRQHMIGEAVVRALETETCPDIDTDRINRRRVYPDMSPTGAARCAAGTTWGPFFVSSRRRDVCVRMRESVTERRRYQHVVPGEPSRRVTTQFPNAHTSVVQPGQQHGCLLPLTLNSEACMHAKEPISDASC